MNKIIRYLGFSLSLFALIAFHSCKEENALDNEPGPAPVSKPQYEATHGGAIVSYTLPEDKNLLFVKAVYVNSLGDEVFRVSSRYGNSIEIDGFADTNEHPVHLYSVGNNGKESIPMEISVKPDTSYIFIIQNNLSVESILGGMKLKWTNPSEKTIFAYIDYDDNIKPRQRILSSSKKENNVNIRGLDTIPYNVSVTIEDFYGNKTSINNKGQYKPLPEQKIDKSTWTVVTNLSCKGDKWEGAMTEFFDDIIDDAKIGGDNNSYFIIHRDDNGGQLRFLSATETSPLLIVIDMHKQVVMNRFVIWQRAYNHSESGNEVSMTTYQYYQDDNMKSFYFYGANDLKEITAQNVWNNPLMICDIGDPRDENGNVPPDKIQEAIDGHEFELPNLSEPFRYIVIGITGTYGSETQICSSEISLYGLDNIIPE